MGKSSDRACKVHSAAAVYSLPKKFLKFAQAPARYLHAGAGVHRNGDCRAKYTERNSEINFMYSIYILFVASRKGTRQTNNIKYIIAYLVWD